MEIRLDPQGEPHWLRGYRAARMRLLRWIWYDRHRLLTWKDEFDSWRFIRRHGGIASCTCHPKPNNGGANPCE